MTCPDAGAPGVQNLRNTEGFVVITPFFSGAFVAFYLRVLVESVTPPSDDLVGWDDQHTMPEALGVVAERYALQLKLGSGGMGAVFSAIDLRNEETVAVKLMGAKRSERRKERFLREAGATLTLHHPNIVRLLDFGIDEHRGYFQVLELLVGETLADRMKRGPIPEQEATTIVRTVLNALNSAHRLGLIHRDLTPENIFLSRQANGEVVPKLIDFGIARDTSARESITLDGLVLGTPLYMAPEQIRGSEIGPAVDFWALGVVAYQLAFGVRPFQARTLPDLYHEQMRQTCTLPHAHPLGDFIVTCLSFDPVARTLAGSHRV